MSVLPDRRPPDDSPADWRVLALAAVPPLAVLVLRVIMPGQPEGDLLYRLEAAPLVSDPGEAFWLAARPLLYGLLVIGAALAGQGVAIGRLPLVAALLREGQLVTPFAGSGQSQRGYYVLAAPQAQANADARDFIAWLHAEAQLPW